MEDIKNEILRFLDEDDKIKQFPSKYAVQQNVLAYLTEKFEAGRKYTEKEVNAIIDEWHSFGDYFLLRRELVDGAWLCRLPNGSEYWRNPDKSIAE